MVKREYTLKSFIESIKSKKLDESFDKLLKGLCRFEEIEELARLGDSSVNPIVFLNLSTRIYLCMKLLQDLSEDAKLFGNVRRELKRLPDRFKRHVLYALAERTALSKLSWVKKILDQLYLWTKEALNNLGFQVMELHVRTVSRTIIGRPSPPAGYMFEVGTRLHPLLGIPYIPASSLKGAFRSYATLMGFRCDSSTIDEIAGTTKECSGIVFTDAYPVIDRELLIEPEVTTSIYRRGEGEIHEEHRAVSIPIIYPTIARNVVFRIIIGLKPLRIPEGCYRVLLQWIHEALREGIGAKTMLGYGMLTIESEIE